jgi:hypothetical protein
VLAHGRREFSELADIASKASFDHRPSRLREAVAFVARGVPVDGAVAALADRGDAVVPRGFG